MSNTTPILCGYCGKKIPFGMEGVIIRAEDGANVHYECIPPDATILRESEGQCE